VCCHLCYPLNPRSGRAELLSPAPDGRLCLSFELRLFDCHHLFILIPNKRINFLHHPNNEWTRGVREQGLDWRSSDSDFNNLKKKRAPEVIVSRSSRNTQYGKSVSRLQQLLLLLHFTASSHLIPHSTDS
jgi:hypothetical protein